MRQRFIVGDIVRYWPFAEPWPEDPFFAIDAERSHQGRVVRVAPDGSTVDVLFGSDKVPMTYKVAELTFHARPGTPRGAAFDAGAKA